eukprot:c16917_g3_i1 orf=1-216(+)
MYPEQAPQSYPPQGYPQQYQEYPQQQPAYQQDQGKGSDGSTFLEGWGNLELELVQLSSFMLLLRAGSLFLM